MQFKDTFSKSFSFGGESVSDDGLFTVEQMRAYARSQNMLTEQRGNKDERYSEKVEGHSRGTNSSSN